MRILSVIASMAESGGAEMLARNLSLAYAAAGHRCHIAYISDAASLDADPAYEEAFQRQMDAAGVTYARIGHDTKRNLLKGGWRLRRMVAAFRPDVLHVHLGYGLLFQALGLVRVPTVYTHHNVVFKFSPRLFRVFDRFVGRYIAICGVCQRLLARHVAKPIVLIPNGVPDDFSAAPVRVAPVGDIDLIAVGNLTPQKDYPTLLAATRRIVDHFAGAGRHVRLRIAGEGAERAMLEARIAATGLGGNVELLGARRDVAALMAQANLLVMTSAWEGLPITLIEAARSALPAVATAVGGCDDIVLNGETGLLVPPGDADATATAVIDLLSAPARYQRFSAATQAHGECFGLSACARAHLAVYGELVKQDTA